MNHVQIRFEILIQTYILYTYLNIVLHNKHGQIHHSDSKLKYHGMTCAWNHTQIANKISLKIGKCCIKPAM